MDKDTRVIRIVSRLGIRAVGWCNQEVEARDGTVFYSF